ncbi:MAG: hypothetical protein R3B07_26475 [Polyangiaceae bacterium]
MTDQEATYDALLSYAREEIRAKQLDRGEAIARQALSVCPDKADAYNVLAVVRERQGQHGEAVNLLRAGLALAPMYAPARVNLDALTAFPPGNILLLGDEAREGGHE